MDIVISASLLIVLLPIFALLSCCILAQRDGTILFPQPRLGKQQRDFRILKFRSMTAGEINVMGRFMRPLGLDELPQLLNIIKGDMSLVGPRPLTVADTKRLGWDKPQHIKRWAVKPGLVGLAQFSPVCSRELSWQLDMAYIERQSLGLDMRIFLWALAVPVLGKRRVAQWLNLPARMNLVGVPR